MHLSFQFLLIITILLICENKTREMANNENNSSSYDFLINSNAFASMHDDQLIPLHPQSFFDSQFLLDNNPNPISNPIPNPIPNPIHNPISSNIEVDDTPIPSIYNGPRGRIVVESPSIVLDAQKKFRGRPKGSKNKPKVAPNMGPSPLVHVIEIKPGFDVLRRVHQFVQTLKTGFHFSGGMGQVRDVLVQTFSAQEPTKSHCGTFELMNVLGYRFGETNEMGSMQAIFNGPRGVFGGYVVGPLMAVGVVNICITTCSNYQFYPGLSPNEGYQIQDPSSDGSSNIGEVPDMDLKPSSGMVLESSERKAKRIRK